MTCDLCGREIKKEERLTVFIKRIEIKNWIGLREFALDPGKINILSGHKGAGKSSVVEAIEKTFANKSRRAEVIRHGENETVLFIQTDDGLEVERKIRTDKSDYLRISKPGQAIQRTEVSLRKLINGEIFRPLEFVGKSPEEQAKIILAMLEIAWTRDDIRAWFGELPADVNYEAHILQILKQIESAYYQQREAINREIVVLKAQVGGIKNDLPPNYDGEKWRAVSIQELYGAVARAEEVNKRITAARSLIDNLESRIESIKAQAEADKQTKKGGFDRKRADLREFKGFINNKIEKARELIANVEGRIKAADEGHDLEMNREIQELRQKYATKKDQSREFIRNEARQVEQEISGYEVSLAGKDQELVGLDELEKQALAAIEQQAAQQAETENAKAGGARTTLEQEKEIDIVPLTENANETAKMQGYLREWDRMANIIRNQLAPKQEASAVLTVRIEKARELPMELLKTASVPIPEITVDSQGMIRIGPTLISDLSDGEKLELAFRVARAQAGELKVICLDGINMINESDRKRIEEEMATDDFQYFLISTSDGELTTEIRKGA